MHPLQQMLPSRDSKLGERQDSDSSQILRRGVSGTGALCSIRRQSEAVWQQVWICQSKSRVSEQRSHPFVPAVALWPRGLAGQQRADALPGAGLRNRLHLQPDIRHTGHLGDHHRVPAHARLS